MKGHIVTVWMVEAQFFGVQKKPLRCGKCLAAGVEFIAKNRMTKRLQMHPQLMRSAG